MRTSVTVTDTNDGQELNFQINFTSFATSEFWLNLHQLSDQEKNDLLESVRRNMEEKLNHYDLKNLDSELFRNIYFANHFMITAMEQTNNNNENYED